MVPRAELVCVILLISVGPLTYTILFQGGTRPQVEPNFAHGQLATTLYLHPYHSCYRCDMNRILLGFTRCAHSGNSLVVCSPINPLTPANGMFLSPTIFKFWRDFPSLIHHSAYF